MVRHGGWWILVAGVLCLLAGACDPYPYIPTTMRTSPAPPPAAGPPPPSPAPAVSARGPDLKQQVEALESRVRLLESRLAELEGRGEMRPRAPAAAPPPAAPSGRLVKAPPVSPVRPVTKADENQGQETHRQGMRLYQEKKYGAAAEQFGRYLKAQPQGSKAPEARYYLAESFFGQGQYREAAVEFDKMARQWPDHILAPGAMLRQAQAYRLLEQWGAARTTLEKLVKQYPGSPAAQEGRKMLKEKGR